MVRNILGYSQNPQKNAATKGNESSPAAAQKNTAASDTVDIPAAVQPYFRLPEIGMDTQRLYEEMMQAEEALKSNVVPYRKSYEQMCEKEKTLAFAMKQIPALQQRYEQYGSAEDAALIQRVQEQVRVLAGELFRAQSSFDAAKSTYEPLYQNYEAAVNTYNSYITEQQGLYDQWRASVRSDRTAIQQDIDKIDQELSQIGWENTGGSVVNFLGHLGSWAAGENKMWSDYQEPAETAARREQLQAQRALLEEELGYSQYFWQESLKGNSDFAEKSKYKSTANGKERSWQSIVFGAYDDISESGWDDPLYEAVNGNKEAAAWLANQATSGYEGVGALWARAENDKSEAKQMNEEEIAVFNYLYATQGSEVSTEYYRYIQSDLNYRERKAFEEEMAQWAQKDPVGSSVFSVALAPMKGFSYAGQAADLLLNGKIDQNSGGNRFSYTGTAIRDAVTKQIEKSGNWGKVGSFAYQVGMSMADFVVNTAASGGNSTLAMAIMGSGAAADTTIAAKDRGLSDGQAFALGTIAGAAEAVTEKFSLEALLKPELSKTAVSYILKNVLTEGSEEGASTLINTMADIIISKDKSEWEKSIQAYRDQGMDEGEAFGRALADQAVALGLDILGGMISGGLVSGGGVVLNNAIGSANGNVQTEDTQTDAAASVEQVQQIMAQLQLEGTKNAGSGEESTKSQAVGNGQQKDYISMEDYANSESPVWNNVDYADDATKKEITQKTHEDMVAAGAVVTVPSEILEGVDKSLPDLRSMKKSERTPILKAAVKLLKDNLRQFLSGFSGQKFEFSVSGKILEARLYSTGINEVLEKVTKQKANMLYSTEDLFRNARYLYSTQDYNGDPNVYRWNYFYTPVQIGNDTVGVRIAVRDMVKGTDGSTPESQIYNWGIKKDASLDGGSHGPKVASPDVSSDASNAIIDPGGGVVNNYEENGGNVYAESTGAGDRVLTGGGQRDAGMGAGEPGRGLAGGTGAAKGRTSTTNSGRAIVDRQNRAKDLVRQGLIQPVSSKELGLPKGTDVKNISVLPQEHWDAELQQIAQEVYDETGKEVTFIVGKMQVRFGQMVSEARGARTQQSIIVQVDNAAATPEQIARHEIFHDKIRQNLWLMTQVRDQVLENHTQEELTKVVSQYAAAWGQTMTVTDDADLDRLMWKIEEEVYADAYAGINYKGAGATRFTEPVQQYARQQDQRKVQRQNNGVRQTNGPNAEQNGANAYQNADFAERNPGFAEQTDDVVYSMDDAEVQRIQTIGKVSVNQFGAADIRKTERLAQRYWSEMGTKSPFFRAWFGDWRANDQTPVQLADQKDNARGVQKNADTGWDIQVSGKVFAESGHFANRNTTAVPYLDYINDIVRKAVLLDTFGMDTGKAKSLNSLLMHSMYAVADIGNGPELLKLYVEEMNNPANLNTAKRAYQLQNIEKASAVNGGVQSNAPSSLANTTNAIRTVADLFAAVKAKDSQFNPKPASKVVNADGTPMVVYHGTSGDFWTFEGGHKRTRGRLNFGEGFYFSPDRAMAENYTSTGRVIDAYLKLENPYTVYGTQLDQSDLAHLSNITGKDVTYDNVTEVLREMGHDGIIARDYNGADNPVNQYVVFDANQIKSATDNIGTFDVDNDDIRYSMDEGEISRIDGEMAAQVKQWEDMYLEDRLGKDGAKEYRAQKAQQEAQRKAENREKDKAKRKEQTEERRQQRQERESKVDAAMNSNLKKGAKPTLAKKELRTTLLDIFSIPSGSRAEIAELIDSMADRMIQAGALTEDLRKAFFTRMYASGAMTVQADEYLQLGREAITKGRIYVDEHVRAEFGDDWNSIRRRAFGAGVYLTNNRADSGIDQWNHELADMLPGLFDSEATDLRQILERIIQVAEEGRAEQVSLAEYTGQLAGEYFVSEDEVLESMERDMDLALRVFAKTAGIEIQVKEQAIRQQAALTKENMRQRLELAQLRQEWKESGKRAQEQKELREMQQKTLKSLQWLNKNRWRAPEELKAAFDEVLSDIDIYAVGAANEMRWSDKYGATWKDLAQMYLAAKDTDPNFMPSKELEMIVSRLNDQKIADMDLGALNDLYKAAVGLRTEFYNRNNVVDDEMHRLFEEVYDDSKAEITAAAGKYTGKLLDRLFNMEQMTAMNVLHRMSGWNPDSTWYSMAKQLENGERDVRAFTVKANRMLEEFLTEHEAWVKTADGQGKDAIWHEIEVPELLELHHGDKPIFGETVKVYMTPAQKVHMYLESKNVDNLRHMMGGRTFADKELYSKGKRKEAFAQGKTIRLAPETVKQIVSSLTEEEMELARVLEKFYNDFAKGEINRVSNVLYGYDKAMGKNYAPIFTNQNYVQSEIGKFDQTAEGVGNMKGRIPYSKNPSYNIGAFDAFERNVEQTARFVGMAIPARNWNTMLNWQAGRESMGDVITHKWGEETKRYITGLLEELQGGKIDAKDVASETTEKLMNNYISSVFGANPGIVLKQLGSIPLASVYLGGGNMPTPVQIRNIDRTLIAKYTQDLDWRSLGYGMPETKMLKDNPNWTQTNKAVKFTFGGGAITAMDTWAASTLWPWAENKVRKEHPELEIGTREQIDAGQSPFYKKVAQEFETAVARSQSTSDQMHQSTLRKSKRTMARMLTLFRSDSAQTYNALRQMIGEAQYAAKNGTKAETEQAKQKVGTVVLAAMANFAMAEAVNFAMAMIKNRGKWYRDDEDELKAESVLEQVGLNMLKSFAGIFAGGEELADMIGAVLTGEKWYEVEAMEVSLVQDLMTLLFNSLDGAREVIADGIEIAGNGGDLLEYFNRHGNDLLGELKDAAVDIAGFLGIPASNVEAYLVGLLKFIPGFEAAYEDLFATATKNDLGAVSGTDLALRVQHILENRHVSGSGDTAKVLAGLYEAGHTSVIPGNTPSSVTVDGESRKLTAYQQQLFDKAWAEIVSGELDALVASDAFTEADPEQQEKMLKTLYSYATDEAKAGVFKELEGSSRADDVAAFKEAGLEMADYLAVVADGYDPERFLEIVNNGLNADDADNLMDEIEDLEPEEGKAQVADVQRWRVCVDMWGDPDMQLSAMMTYMTDSQFTKAQTARDFDVDLSDFVKLYEIRAEYDANGNKSYSQAEYKAAIDSMGLNKEDSAVLWQLITGAKSAKNNPYSVDVGQKVLDNMG